MSRGKLIVRLAVVLFGLMILGGAFFVSQGESSEAAVSAVLLLPT